MALGNSREADDVAIAPSAISETVTAAVTRNPDWATTRTSTPSPSAAMASVVNTAAVWVIGGSSTGGIRPSERTISTTRKPTMNHGTNSRSLGARLLDGRLAEPARNRHYRAAAKSRRA